MSSQAMPGSLLKESAKSLLKPEERQRLESRKRTGRIFQVLIFIPVLLASALIVVLFGSIILDTFTYQVVEAKNSGQTFAHSAANSWREVVELDLLAQGESAEAIDAFFNDAEELRKYKARNRVELVYVPKVMGDESGWRWVVTNNRDDLVENFGLFEGRSQLTQLKEAAGDDKLLYLNPWLDFSFFARNNSGKAWLTGLQTALLGSLWVIGLVILFALPIGVGTAVYLEEYAPKNRFAEFLEVNLRNLAGVPSIVYGILGLYAFVRLMKLGPVILAAALTLSLLILPVVVIAAREAIRAVPDSLRQASYGLGATRWQTVSQVILPNALSGIVTGVILSVARAIGETAPLLLVGGAGFITEMPSSPLSPYAVMPTQIYSWLGAPQTEFDNAAAAGIIALLLVLIALYVLAFFIRRRVERKW
jgi:phosphate transport system permease protein